MPFIQAILGFLGGPIAREIRGALRDRQNAANDAERIAADQRIATLETIRSVQTAGSATWIPKAIRALWSLPLILYLWKLVVWDKILGWGVTDTLGAYELWVGQAIVTFYFVTGAIQVLRK